MSFVKKDPPWKDRELQVESNQGKRTITDLDTNTSQVVKFSKDEGKVYEPKSDFTAERMNNLEERIYAGFEAIQELINPEIILNRFYPIGTIYTSFVNTSPSELFGGTWESISGGLLMPSDDLPDTMITADNHVAVQKTTDYNNQTITPKGSVIGKITIGKGYADMPAHSHKHKDTHSFYPGAEYVDWNEKQVASSYFTIFSGTGGISKRTSMTPKSSGHEHAFTQGNITTMLNNIPINIEKPALTVYCWVRVL